jgi:hypothetical protein
MDVYRACGVLHGFGGPLEPLPLTETSALRVPDLSPQRIAMLQNVFGWLDAEYDKIPDERVLLDAPGLTTTVLRLPMVYGPGDPLRRLHPLVRRVDDSRREIIVPCAGWRATRGYVEDVALAIARAATTELASGIFNVGDADAPTELGAQLVTRTAGWTGELVVLPDDKIRRTCACRATRHSTDRRYPRGRRELNLGEPSRATRRSSGRSPGAHDPGWLRVTPLRLRRRGLALAGRPPATDAAPLRIHVSHCESPSRAHRRAQYNRSRALPFDRVAGGLLQPEPADRCALHPR